MPCAQVRCVGNAENRVYWKEVRTEAWTKTRAEFWARTRITILLSILGFALSCIALAIMGVPIPITVFVGFAAAVGANVIYLLGQWCTHLVAIPPEKDAARLKTIEERDATIAAFQASRPDPIRIELTYVEFAVSTPTTSVVHINVTIRNSGRETTLEWPRLRSVLYGDIARCLVSQIDEHAGIIEIGERKKKTGFSTFKINSPIEQVRLPDNKWWVEFTDIEGRTYKADVPPASYVDLRKWQLPNP